MTTEQEKAIDKIKKLLRLGHRTNHAGERDTALAKAAEIAAAAGIDISGILAGDGERRITSERTIIARRTHARILAHAILRYNFGVFVVGGCGQMTYFGPAVNIAIAKHVEIYLLREASREWSAYRDTNRLRKRGLSGHRKLWERGFFGAVDDALRKRPLRNDAEALRQEVERYACGVMRFKSHKVERPRAKSLDDIVAGRIAGDNINLSRPVETSGKPLQIGGTP